MKMKIENEVTGMLHSYECLISNSAFHSCSDTVDVFCNNNKPPL